MANADRIDGLLRDVGDVLLSAIDLFPALHSPHEGWAVIKEELDELWEAVKANRGHSLEAREEAMQIAAMGLRYAYDIRLEQERLGDG